MEKFICQNCGKEFLAKKSSNRKYCCKQCFFESVKGVSKSSNKKVKVVCKVCGKVEYVFPSRAKKYTCCSVECLSKFNSDRYSKKITCVCPICGKEF